MDRLKYGKARLRLSAAYLPTAGLPAATVSPPLSGVAANPALDATESLAAAGKAALPYATTPKPGAG